MWLLHFKNTSSVIQCYIILITWKWWNIDIVPVNHCFLSWFYSYMNPVVFHGLRTIFFEGSIALNQWTNPMTEQTKRSKQLFHISELTGQCTNIYSCHFLIQQKGEVISYSCETEKIMKKIEITKPEWRHILSIIIYCTETIWNK